MINKSAAVCSLYLVTVGSHQYLDTVILKLNGSVVDEV